MDSNVRDDDIQEKGEKKLYCPITFSQREIDEGFNRYIQETEANKPSKKRYQPIGLTQ